MTTSPVQLKRDPIYEGADAILEIIRALSEAPGLYKIEFGVTTSVKRREMMAVIAIHNRAIGLSLDQCNYFLSKPLAIPNETVADFMSSLSEMRDILQRDAQDAAARPNRHVGVASTGPTAPDVLLTLLQQIGDTRSIECVASQRIDDDARAVTVKTPAGIIELELDQCESVLMQLEASDNHTITDRLRAAFDIARGSAALH